MCRGGLRTTQRFIFHAKRPKTPLYYIYSIRFPKPIPRALDLNVSRAHKTGVVLPTDTHTNRIRVANRLFMPHIVLARIRESTLAHNTGRPQIGCMSSLHENLHFSRLRSAPCANPSVCSFLFAWISEILHNRWQCASPQPNPLSHQPHPHHRLVAPPRRPDRCPTTVCT